MPYNQRNQAGRGPKQKTGAGIPSALLQNDEKSGSKLTREEEVQKRYPGATKRKGENNEYSYKGTTLIPSYKKKEELSDSDKIKKAINEQSPAKQKMVSSENMTVAEKKKMKDNSVFGPDGKNVALPPYEKKKLVKGSNKKDEKKPKPAPSPAKQTASQKNGMKYDIKEASNQKLSAKARKNYAENAQHDSKKVNE